MNPAMSVLIFTVSSGAGYGLLGWALGLQIASGRTVNMTEFFLVGFIGLALVTLGLLSSTLHLANPKNAWRAFSRFRTSWLSREGVFAVLFYPFILAYAMVLWLNAGVPSGLSNLLGLFAVVIALLTVICTGMIYASLKPIRQWHNRLTTPLYILFSAMSGCLLLVVLWFAHDNFLSGTLVFHFVCLAALTLVAKLAYFFYIGKPEGLTIGDATGFSQAQVRLLDAGHSAKTFLSNEFVYDAGAVLLMNRRRWMLLFTFVLPVCITLVAIYIAPNFVPREIVYLAIPCLFIGLLLERWLFFAEARHVVRLYHGDQQT